MLLMVSHVPEMGWCEFDPTNNISGNVILLLPMGDYSDISKRLF
jgi:hypothetical protein